MDAERYSKVVGGNDIKDRLAAPQSWMDLWRREFRNGVKEAQVRVSCVGYAWEFRCAIRDGRHEKPVLQAFEWQRFLNFVGLRNGDRIILGAEEDPETGFMTYNFSLQRRDADGHWVDIVQPPKRAAPVFYQFPI